jgi:hypothetical protein
VVRYARRERGAVGAAGERREGVTVETPIPQSVSDRLYFESGKLDGIGPAYYANSEQLDLINQAMDGIRVWP